MLNASTPPAARQPIPPTSAEVRRAGRAGRSAVSCSRGAGLLRAQPGCVTSRERSIINDLVPERRVAVAHGQMDEGARSKRVVLDFWRASSTSWCAPRSSSPASTCRRSTPCGGRTGRPAGSRPASSPDPQVASAAPASRATPTCSSPGPAALRGGLRSRTVGEPPSWDPVPHRHARPGDRGRQPARTGQTGHVAAVGYDPYVQMVNEAIAPSSTASRCPNPPRSPLGAPARLAHLPPTTSRRRPAPRRLPAAGRRASQADVDDIQASGRTGLVPCPTRRPASRPSHGCGPSACAPGRGSRSPRPPPGAGVARPGSGATGVQADAAGPPVQGRGVRRSRRSLPVSQGDAGADLVEALTQAAGTDLYVPRRTRGATHQRCCRHAGRNQGAPYEAGYLRLRGRGRRRRRRGHVSTGSSSAGGR